MATQIQGLSQKRFNALAGYARDPNTIIVFEEIEWHATADERLLGIVTRDRFDHDFGWIVLGRDERFRFRAINVNASLATSEEARYELYAKLLDHHIENDAAYYQGDAVQAPTDFFAPLVEPARRNPLFRLLTDQLKFSPAKGIIEPMMRFFEDVDGNFIEQFQTTAFDARLWELYLYATFVELGYARVSDRSVPDFVFRSPFGVLAIEATTINPPNSGAPAPISAGENEAAAYLENLVPIKIARVIRRKMEKRYWERADLQGVPFVLAVQDFHMPGSMQTLTYATTEYLFGVRHSIVDGRQRIERITEHVWKNSREKSGFFNLPGSEHVSAVIINPLGTINKFNRLGLLTGFGERNIKIIKRGLARGELNPSDPRPVRFVHDVNAPGYDETWVEGMVVFHNPNAVIPLSPEWIDGACHEFLEPDGRIMSMLPPFHPYISETATFAPGET